MASKEGTTTCHRYCTAYLGSNEKPVKLAMIYVRSDEDEADGVERVLAHVENYPLEINSLVADSGFHNEPVIRCVRDIAATVIHVPKKVIGIGQTRRSQVVHDDLSQVQGQRAGTVCPALGCCLLPERKSGKER
jgi:hypothetical protein